MSHLSIRHCICISLAALFLQALPAHAEDYTDIWWAGPAQDGWGVNLIQSQDFIFATFFVYGPAPAKTPIWYAGNLTRTPSGSFTGGLYQTSGTGIGATWNPADHPTPVQVGNVTFTPTSSTTGTLVYNVGAIVVNKDIVRQTLTAIALGGSYVGSAVVVSSGCAGAGSQIFDVDPVVTQNTGGEMQIVLTFGSETCTMQGLYAQEGTLFRIPTATYVCTNGSTTTVNTTATVYEVKATSIGLEGRWNAPNVGGCVEDGTFSAVFP